MGTWDVDTAVDLYRKMVRAEHVAEEAREELARIVLQIHDAVGEGDELMRYIDATDEIEEAYHAALNRAREAGWAPSTRIQRVRQAINEAGRRTG